MQCTEFGVAAQSSLSTEDPTSKQLLRPWRVQLAPHWNGTMDFKLVQYACDLPDLWCPPCDLYVRNVLVDLTRQHVPRATCRRPTREAPSPFRRFGASIGATPVPIGPAVRALCPEMLGHTQHTDRLTNTSRRTFFVP